MMILQRLGEAFRAGVANLESYKPDGGSGGPG